MVFRTIKEILDDGIVGDVLTISHKEVLESYHASSYYRRWHRKKENSGDLILTKNCHDLDIITWYAGARPQRVSAFASRKFFTPDKKRADYCSQCPTKDECQFAYRASGLHLSDQEKNNPTKYGLDLCVFNEDSDINDTYNGIILYENGIQASFELVPLSNKETRVTYIVGDKGDLRGDFADQTIIVNSFQDGSIREYKLGKNMDGHGGGDPVILDSFIKAVWGENVQIAGDMDGLLSTALASCMRISAETGKTIDFAI